MSDGGGGGGESGRDIMSVVMVIEWRRESVFESKKKDRNVEQGRKNEIYVGGISCSLFYASVLKLSSKEACTIHRQKWSPTHPQNKRNSIFWS